MVVSLPGGVNAKTTGLLQVGKLLGDYKSGPVKSADELCKVCRPPTRH